MNPYYHKLLRRQVRRTMGDAVVLTPGLEALLDAVSQAYEDADGERTLIERSLEMMSRELNERHEQLRTELRERQQARDELLRKTEEQQELIKRLEEAHNQLLQSEKMAAIGQLAAGVAHEINNPMAYVSSNLRTLRSYVDALLAIVAAYEAQEHALDAHALACLRTLKQENDYDYLRTEVLGLLDESSDGALRVKQIVQDLKDFSHVGEQEWQWADVHKGLDSTLNIVNSEVKYVAEVTRCYGSLPPIECLASQLNQVFMNLMVNAAHAMNREGGRIVITTGLEDEDHVFVDIADNGCGIPPENLKRIFDPFFTTKAIGKGTGLGLSLSYGIVRKHGGRIEVSSEAGAGARFRVSLPVRQPQNSASTADLASSAP
jgi:two-component system, NtrC family, sensor kinase